MSEPKRYNYNAKRWHKRKKQSPESTEKRAKRQSTDTSVVQSLDPLEASNLLSLQKNHITAGVPYFGWKLFFHDEEYSSTSSTLDKIRAIEGFIERQRPLLPPFSLENIESCMEFTVDIREISADEQFMKDWPEFGVNLFNDPEHSLNCIKLAKHQDILDMLPKESLETLLTCISTLPTVRLKVLNYQPMISLRELKINYYGMFALPLSKDDMYCTRGANDSKLIATRGCVIRVGRVKHLAQWCAFSCVKCKMQKLLWQPQGNYTLPKKCDACGVSKFKVVLDSMHMKTVPYQMIKIQEPLNEDQENKGRVPRTIDVQLESDLVNCCMPGDDISVTGIVKLLGANDNTPKANATNSYSLYMEAITLSTNKDKYKNSNVTDNGMSIKDYLAIKEIYNSPDVFSLLVHSLCPTIYGHEMVKAGLILGLFGGNMKRSATRNDIHVLVVGDPGLGKSQMLQASARVAVKGVYVCGNSSTSSGLTVTLTKEAGMNDFALEPGALVLSDGGCCCIDEFDKMTTQHRALLECMEQQTVSVAKSGVVCCLPARSAILAAANPINGRYDRSKTLLQNLNMSQPLLSRFDLLFLLVDDPDEDLDNLLCKHVMAVHTASNVSDKTKRSVDRSELEVARSSESSLRARLRAAAAEEIDAIPQSILRKYISYARQYVDPVITEEAAKTLKEFYLELRSCNEMFCDLPIYTRQLEAMIRLTEARAKLDLREEATKQDALEIIEILRYTLKNPAQSMVVPSFNLTQDGKITDRKVQAFIQLLSNNTKDDKQKRFTVTDLKAIAGDGGILINDFTRFISRLNDQGYLLKGEKNTFKFTDC